MNLIREYLVLIPMIVSVICIFSPYPIKIGIAMTDLLWVLFIVTVVTCFNPDGCKYDFDLILFVLVQASPLLVFMVFYVRKYILEQKQGQK